MFGNPLIAFGASRYARKRPGAMGVRAGGGFCTNVSVAALFYLRLGVAGFRTLLPEIIAAFVAAGDRQGQKQDNEKRRGCAHERLRS